MRSAHLDYPPMEPFLDFMATLILALAATAAWGQINTLAIDQPTAPPNHCELPPPPIVPAPPPLTVHVAADHVAAGRDWNGPCPTSATASTFWSCTWVGGTTDLGRLGDALRIDRGRLPERTQIVVVTDDGVPYGRLIEVIDLARGLGYEDVLLGGGPPSRAMP